MENGKRIITIVSVVILILAISLSGCGKTDDADVKTNEKASSEQVIASETDSSEQVIEPEEESPEQIIESEADSSDSGAENSSPESVDDTEGNIITDRESISTDGTYLDVKIVTDGAYDYEEVQYARMIVDTVCAGENVPAALKNAVEQWNIQRKTEAAKEFETAKSNARQDYQDMPDGFYGPYEVSDNLYIKRSDSKVLAVQGVYYGYYGGTHGSIVYSTRNWDSQTGEVISLETVIPDRNKLIEVLANRLDVKYPDIMVPSDDSRKAFEEYFAVTAGENIAWTLDYDGVTFYFGHYSLATYADGVQSIKILYSEMPELFTASYFTSAPADYIEQVETSVETETDLDGDNKLNGIAVTAFYSYEYDMIHKYMIDVDGVTLTVDSFCYEINLYLIRRQGKTFLYVEKTVDSDGREIDIYELRSQTIIPVSSEFFYLDFFTNPDCFKMSCRMDVLGTHFGVMTAKIGEDGLPFYLEDDFKLSDNSITSKVELEVQAIDADGKVTGEIVCPAGTVFVFDRTDGVTYVDMKLADGSRCRITVSGEGAQTVNGMSVFDCFDGLQYAG